MTTTKTTTPRTKNTLARAIKAFRKSDPTLIAAGVVEKAAKLKMETAKLNLPKHPGSGGSTGYYDERVYNTAFTAWLDACDATDAVLDTFLDTL